jgi:hypothetical protein
MLNNWRLNSDDELCGNAIVCQGHVLVPIRSTLTRVNRSATHVSERNTSSLFSIWPLAAEKCIAAEVVDTLVAGNKSLDLISDNRQTNLDGRLDTAAPFLFEKRTFYYNVRLDDTKWLFYGSTKDLTMAHSYYILSICPTSTTDSVMFGMTLVHEDKFPIDLMLLPPCRGQISAYQRGGVGQIFRSTFHAAKGTSKGPQLTWEPSGDIFPSNLLCFVQNHLALISTEIEGETILSLVHTLYGHLYDAVPCGNRRLLLSAWCILGDTVLIPVIGEAKNVWLERLSLNLPERVDLASLLLNSSNAKQFTATISVNSSHEADKLSTDGLMDIKMRLANLEFAIDDPEALITWLSDCRQDGVKLKQRLAIPTAQQLLKKIGYYLERDPRFWPFLSPLLDALYLDILKMPDAFLPVLGKLLKYNGRALRDAQTAQSCAVLIQAILDKMQERVMSKRQEHALKQSIHMRSTEDAFRVESFDLFSK